MILDIRTPHPQLPRKAVRFGARLPCLPPLPTATGSSFPGPPGSIVSWGVRTQSTCIIDVLLGGAQAELVRGQPDAARAGRPQSPGPASHPHGPAESQSDASRATPETPIGGARVQLGQCRRCNPPGTGPGPGPRGGPCTGIWLQSGPGWGSRAPWEKQQAPGRGEQRPPRAWAWNWVLAGRPGRTEPRIQGQRGGWREPRGAPGGGRTPTRARSRGAAEREREGSGHPCPTQPPASARPGRGHVVGQGRGQLLRGQRGSPGPRGRQAGSRVAATIGLQNGTGSASGGPGPELSRRPCSALGPGCLGRARVRAPGRDRGLQDRFGLESRGSRAGPGRRSELPPGCWGRRAGPGRGRRRGLGWQGRWGGCTGRGRPNRCPRAAAVRPRGAPQAPCQAAPKPRSPGRGRPPHGAQAADAARGPRPGAPAVANAAAPETGGPGSRGGAKGGGAGSRAG